jgi:hypothetical protein
MTDVRLSNDGRTLTVRVPMTFAKRGGRKVIIAPDGGDAWAPAKPRPDSTLIRALARAHRWKRLLEEGKHRSAVEIADAEGVTRSFVNRLLRLTLLAPDIVGAIFDGRQRCRPYGTSRGNTSSRNRNRRRNFRQRTPPRINWRRRRGPDGCRKDSPFADSRNQPRML